MDNLDIMITEAFSEKHEPDEYLVQRTLAAMYENRKQNITAVNLILLVNMLWVVLFGLIIFLLPSVLRVILCFAVMMWLAAIIPVYVIARQKLRGMPM